MHWDAPSTIYRRGDADRLHTTGRIPSYLKEELEPMLESGRSSCSLIWT